MGNPEPTVVMAAGRQAACRDFHVGSGRGGAGIWWGEQSGPRGKVSGSHTVQNLRVQLGVVGSHWRVFSGKVTDES